MNLDEAMKALILGHDVGRHSNPEMRLRIVSKKECPGLSDKDLDKLKGTAIVDINSLNEDKTGMINFDCTTNDKGEMIKVRRDLPVATFAITYTIMRAEDFYVYEEGKNLTSEKAYELVMAGKKVYNDKIFPAGVYLAKYTDDDGEDGPALFYPNGQVFINPETTMPWWTPKSDEEFDNYYYIK